MSKVFTVKEIKKRMKEALLEYGRHDFEDYLSEEMIEVRDLVEECKSMEPTAIGSILEELRIKKEDKFVADFLSLLQKEYKENEEEFEKILINKELSTCF